MANYCSNRIVFVGDVSRLKTEFERMQNDYEKNQTYQLPEGFEEFTNKSGEHIRSLDFLFEVLITECDEKSLTVEYETRWDISVDTLAFIAKKYEVEFHGCFVPDELPLQYSGIVYGVYDQFGVLETKCLIIENLVTENCMPDQIHPSEVCELSKEYYDNRKAEQRKQLEN